MLPFIYDIEIVNAIAGKNEKLGSAGQLDSLRLYLAG